MSLVEYCTQSGFDLDRLAMRTRKREIVIDRKNACFEFWRNGFTQQEIAQCLSLGQSVISYHISNPYKPAFNDF